MDVVDMSKGWTMRWTSHEKDYHSLDTLATLDRLSEQVKVK